jgi:hypothetical protein
MKLRVDGGDGDQSYFSEPIELEVVKPDWFSAKTPRGTAILTRVLSGRHAGEYIALTSRVLASLKDQLASGGASVVVMVVRRPGPGFEPTLAQLDAIGMSFVEVVS